MRVQVADEKKDWVTQVSEWVHAHVAEGEKVYLPAGGTPLEVYQQWSTTASPLLHTLKFLQIDEVLNGPQKGLFRAFFEKEMRPYRAQFEWIGPATSRADVAILGVGVNGHVAFHEPGLPRDFRSGCVRLSAETRGYLKLADPTWGLTYGVGSFLDCRKILLLARGEVKRAVLARGQNQELPVSWIMRHPDVTLISDFEFGPTSGAKTGDAF